MGFLSQTRTTNLFVPTPRSVRGFRDESPTGVWRTVSNLLDRSLLKFRRIRTYTGDRKSGCVFKGSKDFPSKTLDVVVVLPSTG